MYVEEAIRKRRSIRRFTQKKIKKSDLKRLIEAARLAPSSGNKQPLAYLVMDDERILDNVFSTLRWGMFLGDRGPPPKGKRPIAYIIVMLDITIANEDFEHDVGLSVENILLSAISMGIGSCCIGSVDRTQLRNNLHIPDRYLIDLVVALGYPAEKSVAEEMEDSISYWKDGEGTVHVPKRRLENIIYWNKVCIKG